jgi:hypothetical protein
VAGTEDFVELESIFSTVARDLFAPGSVEGTLQQIATLAHRTVDGCDAAGILLIGDRGEASTVTASEPFVRELDRLQSHAGEGPCLDAATLGSTVYAADLIDDTRWPTFAPAAVAAGVRSVLAYSLSAGRLSALNLYAHLPAAFGATDRAQAQLFATLARLALDTAESHAADSRNTESLTAALRTRELIGQAQGILMERERITASQAFDLMRRASQRMNIKVRDIAEALVETGESPEAGT